MFNACRLLTPPLILASSLAFGGCSTLNPSSPTLTVPASLKAHCERPAATFLTLGDLGAYTVRLKGAADCETARADAVVSLVEGWNAILHPPKRKWWRFGKPDDG